MSNLHSPTQFRMVYRSRVGGHGPCTLRDRGLASAQVLSWWEMVRLAGLLSFIAQMGLLETICRVPCNDCGSRWLCSIGMLSGGGEGLAPHRGFPSYFCNPPPPSHFRRT